jgi:lipopolysaccharide heptosyltransferase II
MVDADENLVTRQPLLVTLKVLILKPSSLGDVVQALPVLRLLKRHRPDSEIFWWIDSRLAPLLEGDPDLTGIVRFERRRWVHARYWPEMLHSILWLREQKFDWVIDLQCLARSGAFGWLANGKFLIGLDEAREGARGFYDVAVRRLSFHTHAVDWYLAVLPRLGVPVHWNFPWLPERPHVTAEIKRKWFGPTYGGKTGEHKSARAPHWIALQPGARWPTKRWPVAYFTELARSLAKHFPDARLVILGGAEDAPLGEIISRAEPSRCLNLCGLTSLPEMVEWLRLCDLMITNDTGPMHVAAALNKPIVALFGPTEPRRTGPYGHLPDVLRIKELPCSPCFKSHCTYEKPNECLKALAPAAVFEFTRRKLP